MGTICFGAHAEIPFEPVSDVIEHAKISVERRPDVYKGFGYEMADSLIDMIHGRGLVGYSGTCDRGMKILRKILDADGRGSFDVNNFYGHMETVKTVPCENRCDGKDIYGAVRGGGYGALYGEGDSRLQRMMNKFRPVPNDMISKALRVEGLMLDAILKEYEVNGRDTPSGKVLDDEKEIFPVIESLLMKNYSLNGGSVVFVR